MPRDKAVEAAKKRATWAAKREAQWAVIARTGVKECPTCRKAKPCHRTDPARSAFSLRKNDSLPRECKTCAALRTLRWNKSPEGRRAYRKKANVEARRARSAEKARRRRAEGRHHAYDVREKKVRGFLSSALQRGALVKPTCCSRCPNGAGRVRYRIAGWFPPGPIELERVVWLCFPCLWLAKHPQEESDAADDRVMMAHRARLERIRGRCYGSDKRGSPGQYLRELRVRPPETWAEIHAAHVAALAAEAPEPWAVDARTHEHVLGHWVRR